MRKPRLLFAVVCVCAFAFVGAVYASDFVATGLNNIVVGGRWSQAVSIRFQATSNAPLAAIRLYWIIANPAGHPGYMSGTGGRYAYTLRKDATGQPGAVLATASMVQNQITGNARGNFPLICFPPIALVRGQYYDVVVENVDSEATVNWSSLDFLWHAGLNNQTPDVQVWVGDEGGLFKLGDGGSFVGSPVALFYADGTIQGHGDIAISGSSSSGLECGAQYGFPALLCQ